MLRQRSLAVSFSVRTILPADAMRLAWVSGTIFGREVVPDVWSTRATSSAPARPGDWALRLGWRLQGEVAGLGAGHEFDHRKAEPRGRFDCG